VTSATDMEQDTNAKRRVVRELIAYFALAFAISWGLGAAVIFFRPQFEAIFGPLGPLITSWPYYLAVCAPTISAVLVSAVSGGLDGVKNLFAALLRPVPIRWVIIAIMTLPVGYVVWGLVERFVLGNSVSPSIDIRAVVVATPILLFTTANIFIDPGPWGEETGWRGFALPRLLTLHSPLTAALILGVVWAVWHAPAFIASGLSQSGLNFGWFLLGGTCLTIVMTWIYVHANRNYLVGGFILHELSNRIVNAHGVTDVKIEALVMLSIVVVIVAVFGPSLKGWRASGPLSALA
jgi:uncharacterized protein